MNDLKIQKSNNKSKQVYTQGSNKWLPESKPEVFRQEKPLSLLQGVKHFFFGEGGS